MNMRSDQPLPVHKFEARADLSNVAGLDSLSRFDSGPPASIVITIIAVVAAIIAIIGNGSALPIDSHEAYVARAAEEMLARQDWLVPTFNNEPRINKPPLCYWLVMLVDRINGADGMISEWEARIPSIAAAIIVACGTAALGLIWFSRWIGLIAGLIVCTCGGFSAYSHSARPEMVYAAWCTLALVAFAHAQTKVENDKRATGAIAAHFGWVCFGLAILSKGPQLPAMLIVGWIAGMLASGQRLRIRAVLRPAFGLLVMCAVWAWWYVLIYQAVPDAGDRIAAETTTGRIFNYEDFSRWSYLDPYYFYRVVGLVIPWMILYPLAIAAPWIFKSRFDPRSRHLWWLILVPMIALHISIGRRWYYLLPALAPLAVLMAKFGLESAHILIEQGKGKLWRTIIILHVLGLLAALIAFRVTETAVTAPPIAGIVAVAAIAGAGLLAMHQFRRQFLSQPQLAITAVLLVGGAFIAAAEIRSSLWDAKRFEQRRFAAQVQQSVPANADLIAWAGDWAREVYYGRRAILEFIDYVELKAHLHSPGDTFLLVDLPFETDMPGFEETLIAEANIEGRTRQLWRIADGTANHSAASHP
jgi:4-amino-4-deoxy-L-arabinose transferase-like glycosyltransferase